MPDQPAEETAPEAEAPPEADTAPEAEAAPAEETAAAEEPPLAREPVEVVPPKERRRRARAAKAAATPTREARTPEERHAERQTERARKSKRRREVRLREREKSSAARREPGGQSERPQARPRGGGKQKTRQGVVVSDKAAKTITVRIDTARPHRRYQKIVRTSRTIHAHDEQGEAHVGDTVIVRECRPLSRTKRWRLERVLERAA
jgi:small subunit ribosomal protein S17